MSRAPACSGLRRNRARRKRRASKLIHPHRHNCEQRPLDPHLLAEKEKHKRYPDSPAPMEFMPVAVGTQIELRASAREVIGMLAKRAAERTCAGLTPTSAAVAREMRIMMGELGIGVMRAQAAQILSYVDGTPHAAIAKILGRGAVRRNLGRRVPAKLCVCSAMTCVCGSGRKP